MSQKKSRLEIKMARKNKDAPEQTLIHDLKAIDVQISNADSFFEQAASNPGVDQMVLYELMEMDGIEKTSAVEAAYAKFRTARCRLPGGA
jgi:hypothetical protein